MTVSTDTRRVQYATNGTTGPFTVTFPFLENSHLAVTHTDSTGVDTNLTLNVDYTVSSGQVTTTVAYASGGVITIDRDIPITQELDLRDGDDFPAESMERALDLLTMIAQQVAIDAVRVLRVPEVAANIPFLPALSDRANRLLAFDGNGDPTVVVPVSGTAADVLIQLANSASAAQGPALLAYNPSLAYGSGLGQFLNYLHARTAGEIAAGVTPTNYAYFPGDVRRYGAVGDNVADDTTGLTAAMNSAGGGQVRFPAGTFRVTSALTVPSNVTLLGSGKGTTTIKRAYNGSAGVAFMTLGASSGLRDLTIDGDTATRGVGVGVAVPASTPRQSVINAEVINFVEPCLQFAADGGSDFKSLGSTYYTTGTVGTVAAVKVNGTDTQAIPRHFYATESRGCTLFDFGGCSDFFASGFYSNSLIFGSAANKVFITNFRIGAAGGAPVIKGGEHQIQAGVFATAVTLDTGTTSIVFDATMSGWDVTDNGTNNAVFQRLRSYSGTLTSSNGTFAIGNGTLVTVFSRSGSFITVNWEFTFGSTTTLGTGNFRLSLPRASNSSYVQASGQGLTQSAAGSDYIIVARVASGNAYCDWFSVNTSGTVVQLGGATKAWAAGDTIRGSITYITA